MMRALFDNQSSDSWHLHICWLDTLSYQSIDYRFVGTERSAYREFRRLLNEHDVGPQSYYLSYWQNWKLVE